MRKPIRILLFLSSYAPLFFICAVAQKNNPALGNYDVLGFKLLSLVLSGLMFVGIAAAAFLVLHSRKMGRTSLQVVSVNKNNQDTLSYLITYLVPFVTLDFASKSALLANALLLFFIGMLYLQSNMTYLNPTLALFGYQTYRAKLVNSLTEKILIARTLPDKGGILKTTEVGRGIYIKHD